MSDRKTIQDVARMAGVSEATVSRVLNNSAGVSAAKRDRVLAAAKTLRFRPNAQARLLAGGRPNTVLLVHPMVESPLTWYFHLLETGILRGCARHGFQLQPHFVLPDSPRRDIRILKPITDKACVGVILAAPFSDDADLIAAVQARHMPFVLVASGGATRGLAPGIGMDDERAGYELAMHLLQQGHRRFGFSLGLPDHLSAQERFAGARRAMAEQGLGGHIVEAPGGLNFDGGYHAFRRIRESGFRPTALICANDESAAGAIHAAHEQSLRLPADLSIAAFDDAPFAPLLSPPLTTMSQGIDVMAARAVDILADAIKGVNRPYEMTRPRLVIRQSTAPV
ncbi:LacI family DNA-binding transcriptional regulator [Asticcacaulis sp.]|uniref:LacI family DNA-binding transcriptional regulator n=1 Tax=Asticcacaulis sp. TaxID=1872648 RepID=UPI003F7C2BE2